MTSEEMQALLSAPNNAIIGVNRAEGGPQLTPVWYVWDGTSFYFTTTKDRAKYPNLKRNSSISLIVDDLATHKYVTAYGRAEIIEQNVGELARPIVKKYVPADKIDQWVQMINNDPKRVLVVLHPEKIITN
ncbi:MAG TPA: PPOX class F420-dependent oxidoreductase [Ktedonobacteraceae bacterium]|jgi:PPOX class probable F420-dependent enzyme|nr:PPOX class F420-dependent oxidoreductase [Ktedonobacteraceae bacterium]